MLVLNKYEGPRAPEESGSVKVWGCINPDVSQPGSGDLGLANLPMRGGCFLRSWSILIKSSAFPAFSLQDLRASLHANQEVPGSHT